MIWDPSGFQIKKKTLPVLIVQTMSLRWYDACWWISAHPWSKPLVKHMLRVHSCAHTICRYPQLTGVHSSGCNNSDAINPIPAGQLFLWCSLGGTFQEVPSLIDVGVSGGQWAMRACVGVGRRKKKKPGLRLHKENRSATKRAQTFRRCKAFKKRNRLGSCQTRGRPLLRPRQLGPMAGPGKIHPVLCLRFPLD